MNDSVFAKLQSQEPALLMALVTFVGSFLAQTGPGHKGSTMALGTSATISGLQGLLTRAKVFSPATVKAGGGAAALLSPSTFLAQGTEPVLTMSAVGALAGFLVQLVGGQTDLLSTLGIAGGTALTQAAITRPLVYSPRTAALTQLRPAAAPVLAGNLAAAGPGPTPTPTPPAPNAAPAQSSGATAAPGDMSTEAGRLALLARYRPVIRYDSLESYYADSAAIITDRPGNLLMRADGTVIAGGPGTPALALDFLRPGSYGENLPAAPTDHLKEVGSDYVEQARQMHAIPEYADRAHGRVVSDPSGTWWLQYWFFMYYDDPGFLGFGRHEGDLEMIQLRLDAQGAPEAASYSQHRSGVSATWAQLEIAITPDGLAPVTYSARGSHANLLRHGISISTRSFLPDHNDGRGYRVRPQLIVLTDDGTPWALWPGSWGGTVAPADLLGKEGIDANSPTAPPRHQAWSRPDLFHASCEPAKADLPPPGQPMPLDQPQPPAPQITAHRTPEGTVVHYSVPADPAAPAPAKIVLSLASKDPSVPPQTYSADMAGPTGTITLPSPPSDGAYEVRGTVHSESGMGSSTAQTDV